MSEKQPIIRNAPDGKVIRFPASMSKEEVDQAMRELYPPIIRNAPDGKVIRFPASMSKEEVDQAMNELYPPKLDLSRTAQTLLPSMAKLGGELVGMVTSPKETLSGLGKLGAGIGQLLFLPQGPIQPTRPIPPQELPIEYQAPMAMAPPSAISQPAPLPPQEPIVDYRPLAMEIGRQLRKDYLTKEGWIRRINEDPATVLADLALGAGGTGVAARAAGLAKMAKVADKTAKVVDPLFLPVFGVESGLKGVGRLYRTIAENLTTGRGAALQFAARHPAEYVAGMKGDFGSAVLKAHPNLPKVTGLLEDIQDTINKMRKDASAQFQSELVKLNQLGPLPPDTVRQIRFNWYNEIQGDPTGKGTGFGGKIDPLTLNYTWKDVIIEPKEKRLFRDIEAILKSVENNPNVTPEILYAVRRKIGMLEPSSNPAKAIHTGLMKEISNTLESAYPPFKKMMEDYSNYMKYMDEVQNAFSIRHPLDKKAVSDQTILNKIDSVMRNQKEIGYHILQQIDQLNPNRPVSRLAGHLGKDWFPQASFGKYTLPIGSGAAMWLTGNPALGALTASLMFGVSSPKLAGHLITTTHRPTVQKVGRAIVAPEVRRTGYVLRHGLLKEVPKEEED